MINPYKIEDYEYRIYQNAYEQGKADAECEYTSKVLEILKEIDADYISIDYLIEVLEWAKEE